MVVARAAVLSRAAEAAAVLGCPAVACAWAGWVGGGGVGGPTIRRIAAGVCGAPTSVGGGASGVVFGSVAAVRDAGALGGGGGGRGVGWSWEALVLVLGLIRRRRESLTSFPGT